METYTALRAFADSWHLLFMFCFFIGMVLFLFRPGSKGLHDDSASMIFRNDDRPAPAAPEASRDRQPENEAR